MNRIFFTLILLFSYSTSAKDVFFVSSYHKEIESIREIFNTLVSSYDLKDKKHVYYIDSKRLNEEQAKINADNILQKIKKTMPRLVFLCDDNALRFLGNRIADLGIKLVFLGLNENPRKYLKSDNLYKTYGILEKPLILRGVHEVNGAIRARKNSVILFDDSITSKAIIKKIFPKNSTVIHKGHSISYVVIKDLNALKDFLANNELSETLLFLGPVHRMKDKDGQHLEYKALIRKLNTFYKKEFYSFWKDYVYKDGAILAYGVDMKEQGQAALKIGKALLNGDYQGPRFITPTQGRSFISNTQLKSRDLKIIKDIRLSEIEYVD